MKPPSRILMTGDTAGGVWNHALELAGALRPHGVEITLVTMGAPLSPIQWQAVRRLPNVTPVETSFRLEWMDDPWADVEAAGECLLELEERTAPDVVHLNGYAHGALPWKAPALVAAHSCVLSWWQAVKGEPAPPRYREYRERVSAGLQGAGTVIAPTRAMLSMLREHYRFEAEGQVVPNGIAPHPAPSAAKAPLIMAAGRLWDEAKNFALLDKAASRLAWPVLVAGDARHPNGSEAVFPNLHCLGVLSPDALSRQLAAASIYALPARYEPFGLSILEAGLRGCALVLGDIPSLREVWGDAALFISPDDEGALHTALSTLIHSEKRRAEMGFRARRRALRYSARAMGDRYIAIYGALLHATREASV